MSFKKWNLLLASLVLFALGIFEAGALAGFPLWLDSPKRKNPNDPMATNYAPPAATPTVPAFTATITPTPTRTNTVNPAWSLTFTPTITPTFSASPTAANTVGACGGTCTTYWGFDSGSTDGWVTGTGAQYAGTGQALSTTKSQCGGNSLAVPFAATDTAYEINAVLWHGINYPTGIDLTGKMITAWVYVAAPTPPNGEALPPAQLCAMRSGGAYACGGSWNNGVTLNTWTQLTAGPFAAGDASDIVGIDVQVYSKTQADVGQTWNGTVYFDSFCIANPAAPTATPTLGGVACGSGCTTSWQLDGADTENWATGIAADCAGTSAALSSTQSKCGGSSMAVPFAATDTAFKINALLYHGLNFPTGIDLTGKTVSCWVYVDANTPPNGEALPPAQLCAMKAGGAYACDGSWNNAVPLKTWTQLTATFAPADNATDIVGLDIQVLSKTQGDTGQTWNGTVYFDSICIGTGATPTPTVTVGAPACGTVCTNYWGFDDNAADGWVIPAGSNIAGTGTGAASTTQSYCGGYSFAVPFTANQTAYVIDAVMWHGLNYPTGVDLTNKAMTCWVYVDAPAVPNGQALPPASFAAVDAGGGYHWGTGNWNPGVPLKTWTMLTYSFTAADNVTGIVGFDIQVYSKTQSPGTGTWSGTVYFDSICIAPASAYSPTPTPNLSTATPTATPTTGASCGAGFIQYYGFDAGSTDGWVTGTGAQYAGTGQALSTTQFQCGSNSLAVPFAATDTAYEINAVLWHGINYPTGVDLTGKTLSAWVYVAAPTPPNSEALPPAQLCAMRSGGAYVCTGSWNNSVALNTWTHLTAGPFVAGDNATDIVGIDVQVFSKTQGDTGQTWSGTVYFDSIGWQ